MKATSEFDLFYTRAKDRCLRTVVLVSGDRAEAEEVTAEAFARAWARWPKVREHPNPEAWVIKTALNHRISRWRRVRRIDHRATDLETAEPEPGGFDQLLLDRVAALPIRQREVIALRFFMDLDTQTTADLLEIAPGTVTAHLHRALTSLRAHYAEAYTSD